MQIEEIFEAISFLLRIGIKIESIPKIVIIAEQNQGKSSLAEALIQCEILPKCEGLCTRKPFNITTIKSQNIFYNIEGENFYNDEIAHKKLVKLNLDNKKDCVNCTIYSPFVQNCDILDTIGLIRNSEEDENLDPKKIKQKTIEYLKNKNNIFVLVSSATDDLATSQALELIKKHGRTDDTLGVFTKMDLMKDQNINSIKKVLNNEIYKLGYGWIATKLRSDKDIESGITIAESINNEKQYFSQLNEEIFLNKCTVGKVKETISYIQFQKIKHNLVNIIQEIDQTLKLFENSLTFLDKLSKDSDGTLASKLEKIIQKLVPSSKERINFEKKFFHKIESILLSEADKLFGENINYKEQYSDEYIPKEIYTLQYRKNTNIEELFSSKLNEFINKRFNDQKIENDILKQEYEKECQISTLLYCFELYYVEEGKEKLDELIKNFLNMLLKDSNLQNIIYETTEYMILNYVNNENEDILSKDFSTYIIKQIGKKTFEEKIKYNIDSLITIEEIPTIDIKKILKQILLITKSQYFDFDKYNNIRKFFLPPNQNKLKIGIYSDVWNISYLKCITQNLSENCYRVVAAQLLNKMISNLLISVLNLNKEKAIKKHEKLQDKIRNLNYAKQIFEEFKNY